MITLDGILEGETGLVFARGVAVADGEVASGTVLMLLEVT